MSLLYPLKKAFVYAVDHSHRASIMLPTVLVTAVAVIGTPVMLAESTEEDPSTVQTAMADVEKAKFEQEVKSIIDLRRQAREMPDSDIQKKAGLAGLAAFKSQELINKIGLNPHISEVDAAKIADDISTRISYRMPAEVEMAFNGAFLADCRLETATKKRAEISEDDMMGVFACAAKMEKENEKSEETAVLGSLFGGALTALGLIFFGIPALRDRFAQSVEDEEARRNRLDFDNARKALEKTLLPPRH